MRGESGGGGLVVANLAGGARAGGNGVRAWEMTERESESEQAGEREMRHWPSLLAEERGADGGERAAGGEMRRRPEPTCGGAALFLSRGRSRVVSKSNRYAHNGWHCG